VVAPRRGGWREEDRVHARRVWSGFNQQVREEDHTGKDGSSCRALLRDENEKERKTASKGETVSG
jgi:hypothetical protein